jgi:mono/diheme cytochrome c family protein
MAFAALIMSFTFHSKQNPWVVPDKYLKMTNPVKSDASSQATGKSLWSKHCQSCHGKQGKGDGSKAATLKTKPGDFSAAAFKGQPDGSIFYKTLEGRKDMPSFKKKIPDHDEIWSIVNYMKTFK